MGTLLLWLRIKVLYGCIKLIRGAPDGRTERCSRSRMAPGPRGRRAAAAEIQSARQCQLSRRARRADDCATRDCDSQFTFRSTFVYYDHNAQTQS